MLYYVPQLSDSLATDRRLPPCLDVCQTDLQGEGEGAQNSTRKSGSLRNLTAEEFALEQPLLSPSPDRSWECSQLSYEEVPSLQLDMHQICNKPWANLYFSKVRGLVFLEIGLLASTLRLLASSDIVTRLMMVKNNYSDNFPSHVFWSAGWTPAMSDQAKGVCSVGTPVLLGGKQQSTVITSPSYLLGRNWERSLESKNAVSPHPCL